MSRRYAFGEQPVYVPDFGRSDTALDAKDSNVVEAPEATEIDPIDYMGRQAIEASVKEEPTPLDS